LAGKKVNVQPEVRTGNLKTLGKYHVVVVHLKVVKDLKCHSWWLDAGVPIHVSATTGPTVTRPLSKICESVLFNRRGGVGVMVGLDDLRGLFQP